jgi:hypothetical protein
MHTYYESNLKTEKSVPGYLGKRMLLIPFAFSTNRCALDIVYLHLGSSFLHFLPNLLIHSLVLNALTRKVIIQYIRSYTTQPITLSLHSFRKENINRKCCEFII